MLRLDASFFIALAVAGFVAGLGIAIPFFAPDADFVVRRGGEASAYIGADFVNMWQGARLAITGDLPTLFDFPRYNSLLRESLAADIPFHSWSYPPHMLLLVAPLAFLPYGAALALWQAATFGAFLWSVWAGRECRRADEPRLYAVMAAATFGAASVVNLLGGQNGFLVAALLIGGFRLLNKRPILAGILFGVLTIKPHLGLTLPFVLLALGAWRSIAAATASAAGLALLSILLFGGEIWASFFTVTMKHQTALVEQAHAFFHYMMPGALIAARLAGASMQAALLLWAACAVVAICLAVIGVRRTDDAALRAALTALAAALASPYFFNYDMTAVSAALVLALSQRAEARLGEAAIFVAVMLLPALVLPLNMSGAPLGPFILLPALFAAMPGWGGFARGPTAPPVAPGRGS